MNWLHPEWFFWLSLLPFGVLIYIFRHRQRLQNLQKWLGRQKVFLTSSLSPRIRHLKMTLSFMALAFFILALARPQGEGEKVSRKSAGVQIILAVDVSRSMMAEDVRPSRLEFLKKELSHLLDISAGDQVALMAFSGSALLISPFTGDLSLIKVYLEDLSPDYLSSQGTNFRSVLKVAQKIFVNIEKKTKKQTVRVLLIASDGEDHVQKWKSALKSLTEKGVRIFTLSVGTKEGGVIPVKNARGEILEYKKDSSGKVVTSKVQPKILKQLAGKGQGAYYHLSYSGQAMKQLRSDMYQLKKTIVETEKTHKRKELFQWFLALGLILAFIELLLNEWRLKRNE
ncbi:MAG: VWA domain-containing protein [Bdellovibrionales bacterium]|nr:VWA domain-containing protein [Bdellovibrionales bacterium]